MDLIMGYKVHHGDFDEGDDLVKFIGTLKRFNHNEDINTSTREWIENYFDYRWNNYKNKAFEDPIDTAILDELPVEIRLSLFT